MTAGSPNASSNPTVLLPMPFLAPMHECRCRFSKLPRHYPCLLAICEKASDSFVARVFACLVHIAVTFLSLLLPPCLFHYFLACFARVDSAVYLFIGYLKYAFQCVIKLLSGDIARTPPAHFSDFLPRNPQFSDSKAEVPMEGVVYSKRGSVGKRTSILPVGVVAKVVPANAIGDHDSIVNLQLPPAYALVMVPRASDPYVNTIGSQLHSTTGLDHRKHAISGSASNFHYEVGSDFSAKSPPLYNDPVPSVSTVVDTPCCRTDPNLLAIVTSTSVPGGPLSTFPTSRTLGDMPTLRRQPSTVKGPSNPTVAASISASSEHHHWLRPCAVCASKKAKITKPRAANQNTKVRKVSV